MTKKEKLAEIKKRMEADKSLPLASGGSRLVFGDGNPDAQILMIGEGPGYWEDQQGLPFVGNAGKLLDQLLATAHLSRNDTVYITNVVHHRPPGNRDPEPSEIAAYGRYLDEMIEVIAPAAIVTLGRFSMAKFLPGAKISRDHGRPVTMPWRGREIVVVPMYHPAAALRSGEVMLAEREDFASLESGLKSLVDKRSETTKESEQMHLV
ncbi:hypothetical protein A3I55_01500 [Candidatus Woesebacteria bacterium RIFCSPLOWO2_02_FULL_42_10]|nr:MAG: hypothetical protein A3I55_01500 [Candidatus Woesebacteria bacterium RIFCSPLOWO2_02_FULL_42_10]